MTHAAASGRKAQRVVFSADEIRAGLVQEGLREECLWDFDGFGFGYGKPPAHAVITYRETHGGAEATRFYCGKQMYVLAE